MIGTRAEWDAARLELLKAEKELTRHSDEIARRRRELPWVPIGSEYIFDTRHTRPRFEVSSSSWATTRSSTVRRKGVRD